MTRTASALPHPPPLHRPSESDTRLKGRGVERQVVYDLPFWLAYASNALAIAAVSLLFRYADFVSLLGGTEYHLGWIVGVGMVGSLVMRLALGSCIDHYGTKVVWLGSTLLFAATCFAHLAITSHTGVAIYLLRIVFCCAVAGFYGASMTFISSRAPIERMAELVGMVGTASYLGTVAGVLLGDYLFGAVTANRDQVINMFLAAGLLGVLSYPFAWLASRAEAPPASAHSTSLLTVLRRHHPGAVLVVAVAAGMALGLPSVFLRPYAAEISIPRIGVFFVVCSITAILMRVLARRWPERFGNRAIIVLGIAGAMISLLLFLLVDAEWQLALPAVGFGCTNAILFPAVVAAGSVTFPARHRGLATLLVLAAFDMGQLIGAPVAGAVLRYSPLVGLRPYPTMFLTMAGLMALVGAWYLAPRNSPPS